MQFVRFTGYAVKSLSRVWNWMPGYYVLFFYKEIDVVLIYF